MNINLKNDYKTDSNNHCQIYNDDTQNKTKKFSTKVRNIIITISIICIVLIFFGIKLSNDKTTNNSDDNSSTLEKNKDYVSDGFANKLPFNTSESENAFIATDTRLTGSANDNTSVSNITEYNSINEPSALFVNNAEVQSTKVPTSTKKTSATAKPSVQKTETNNETITVTQSPSNTIASSESNSNVGSSSISGTSSNSSSSSNSGTSSSSNSNSGSNWLDEPYKYSELRVITTGGSTMYVTLTGTPYSMVSGFVHFASLSTNDTSYKRYSCAINGNGKGTVSFKIDSFADYYIFRIQKVTLDGKSSNDYYTTSSITTK